MKYKLWLSLIPGLGSASRIRLSRAAQGAGRLFGMEKGRLQELALSEREIDAVLRAQKEISADEAWGSLCEKGIGFVSMEDDRYPNKLRNIADPPYSLYYIGNLPEEGARAAAIVGARNRSEYGRQLARELARRLATAGIAVISGLARGIDADGHTGALDGGGRTYAVLGCGADVCYPVSNRYLYERILAEGGGILSEFPPGTPAIGRQFPSRNRIISGLSDLVILVEAKTKSGSLITADYAMEQGKDIYAVPGRITDPLSGGTNRLIRQGAGMIADMDDFLSDLTELTFSECTQLDFRKNLLEKDETMVYSLLDFCPKGIGTLVQESGYSLSDLLRILDSLKEKQFIRESVPNYFVRTI